MDLTYLPKAWKRGTEFLGVRYAILCGGMTWVSEPNLVSAISNAGGFGVLAAGNMPPAMLEEQIVPAYYERDEKGLPRRWIAGRRPRTTSSRSAAASIVAVFLQKAKRT